MRTKGIVRVAAIAVFSAVLSVSGRTEDVTGIKDPELVALAGQLNTDDTDEQRKALLALAGTGDDRVADILQAYRDESIYVYKDGLYVCEEVIENDDLDEFLPLTHLITREPVMHEGKALVIPIEDAEVLEADRKVRALIRDARYLIRLSSPERTARLSGAKKCGDPPGVPAALDKLKGMAESDSDSKIRAVAQESILLITLRATGLEEKRSEHLVAATELGVVKSLRGRVILGDMITAMTSDEATAGKVDQEALGVYKTSLAQIESHQAFVDKAEVVFQGLSLGSVLILMALGLAITFGLMGVINMAHGELMMIGAYATYQTQMMFTKGLGFTTDCILLISLSLYGIYLTRFKLRWPTIVVCVGFAACSFLLFRNAQWLLAAGMLGATIWMGCLTRKRLNWPVYFISLGAFVVAYAVRPNFMGGFKLGPFPSADFDLYYLFALPASFLIAAFVGYIIEILVVRHLYRRSIESLLATWGVGIILIQLVRQAFGDNIGVNAPEWARGGVEIMQDVVLPYGRVFIIGLCIASVALIYFIMRKTTLGLRMRATMQNRDTASSLGVNSQMVDRMTFAFGSGIAGIAGCAWTLIGGVTPDMGQKNFIVDAFLVVVTGGVGELAGVAVSGLGIGVTTKLLEPASIGGVTIGAIWAKVLLLVIVVIFIQFKPSGVFAPKGRLADD